MMVPETDRIKALKSKLFDLRDDLATTEGQLRAAILDSFQRNYDLHLGDVVRTKAGRRYKIASFDPKLFGHVWIHGFRPKKDGTFGKQIAVILDTEGLQKVGTECDV